MLPFCFEWSWGVDHIIFFGLLYLALVIVGLGLTFVGIKTFLQVVGILWEKDM